jgi:spore germination cell wall hydrolase CwlJ-like protein
MILDKLNFQTKKQLRHWNTKKGDTDFFKAGYTSDIWIKSNMKKQGDMHCAFSNTL